MSRYVPLLLGERGRTLRSPSASTLQRKARKPAKRSNPKRGNPKRKKTTKKATKKKGAKKRTTKRGGVVKPSGKFEHLRVRTPSSFKKSTFKTIPWGWVPDYEQKFIRRKLGLRRIPRGTKAITGAFKPGATKDRIKGKRVDFYSHGIQTLLVPITGGKKPKSPRGTKKKTKKKAAKIVKRATRTNPRRNHHTTKAGRGKYAQVCMKIYGPIKSKAATLKNPATKRRPDLDQWVKRAGDPVEVIETLRDYQLKLVGTGNFRAAEAVQRDVEYLRKKYKVKRSAIRSWGTRANPGRLAILANPLPKEVEESAAKMRGEKRRRFLAYYASLKAGDQKRLVKGLRLYKRRHKVPCTDFELKRVKGARPDIEVGVGRAQAIEYHANKGYQGSSKRGTPFRHEFENNQHVVSDENGRALKVVDARGAKRRTITTDWIYN